MRLPESPLIGIWTAPHVLGVAYRLHVDGHDARARPRDAQYATIAER